jgi:hypothetical protein
MFVCLNPNFDKGNNPESSDKHHLNTRKQAKKEWFDEECAMWNEKKTAARERAIQIKTRGVKNAYKPARTKPRRLFRKKGE